MIDPTFKTKIEVDKADYGLFVIEPLEQGYGQTLGNSLRRVLLTSLQGVAVTNVKIEGVRHQFTTIPGLKEDVVEFLLNIKKIRVVSPSDEPVTLTLSKKGPGEVRGSDIEGSSGVVIVNPDVILGTLTDKKASITMEMTAEKGFGYVSSDEKKVDEIGRIPVSAFFSPITRVNYRVEATRVGRITNFDKLIMEIWTDGTILPLDALKQSAKILVSYFFQVVEPKAAGIPESVAVSPMISDEVLKMRIEELDIPTRIVNALGNGGIETVGQLLGTPRGDLMKIKNLGTKSLGLVEDKLREKGVALTV